ncbi:MAG: NAD(P)-dependent oxidoreductase, partial [Clostridia bacterium]|nr:NAD(P)-dependent oxidoreductase [Clostridia bacterium]
MPVFSALIPADRCVIIEIPSWLGEGEDMGNYLVTGARGGMGSAICRMLAENGHRVWGIDLASDGDAGGQADGIAVLSADLTDREAL